MFNKKYTLTRCRRTLKRGFYLYTKKSTRLSRSQYTEFESTLKQLDQALLTKNRTDADHLARLTESFIQTHFPKTLFDSIKELVGALLFALVVAFCVRQFWFELYEVPTGSMRPTILEQDRLFVSKTTFGINFPFTDRLWLFHPDRIQRGGTIVFTTANMDIDDSNMRYFYLFPGKKRFVKRCMAKGGDTIYFYGGRIYGIDKEEKPFLELADTKWLEERKIASIDHIPVITFEGNTSASTPIFSHVYSKVMMEQMNEKVAKIRFANNFMEGRFFDGNNWIKEEINLLKEPHKKPVSYGDLWGINNYAMARLLTAKEAKKLYPQQETKAGISYLELRHTPNVTFPQPLLRQSENFITQPMITPYKTLLPVDELHLNRLMDSMTTGRFIVKDHMAYRYTEGRKQIQPSQFNVHLPNVRNGIYEFYRGKAYKIHFGGIRTELDKEHPLFSKNATLIHTLFNMGVNFNTLYQPTQVEQPFIPQRFAFYREGRLYVMDAPLFTENELSSFVENELSKQNNSSSTEPYIAFIDRGAPIKEGVIDIEFMKAFGLKVPEGTLLALGDNYAGSADSRDFGFVPMHNLRGAPLFTFWPPGTQVGALPQTHYPWLTLPNFIIGTIAGATFLIIIFYIRKRNKKSLFDIAN